MIPIDLPAIANHLWQSTLFAIAAGLLTLTLRKNRAAVRYGIWLAASVKFLIPFSLLVEIGRQFEWRTAPSIAGPAFTVAMGRISQPFALPVHAASLAAAPRASESDLPAILFVLWLCGAAIGLIFWMRLLWTIREIRDGAKPSAISSPVPVMLSSGRIRMEPGVFGIVRPVIILPDGITAHLSPLQLEGVIAHELCHVRRRDNLTAAVHMVVEVIFWFHPLVLWVRKQLIEERERACDEDVIQASGDPQTYAQGILRVCRLHAESRLLCVSGITGANLRRRIEAILEGRAASRLNLQQKAALAISAIVTLATPIAIGVVNAPPLRAQPATETVPAVTPVNSRGVPLVFEAARITRGTDPGGMPKLLCFADCSAGHWSVGQYRVGIRYLSLQDLIALAYGVKPYQLSGPDWMKSERFDILATIPKTGSKDYIPEMLQNLLAERFGLAIHREREEQRVYGLMVAQSGLKLRKSVPEADGTVPPPAFDNGIMRTNPSMRELADILTQHRERPVVDMTKLTGNYQVVLDIRVPPPPKRVPGESDGPSLPPNEDFVGDALYRAMSKGGLRLERTRARVEIIVVDQLAKSPTPN